MSNTHEKAPMSAAERTKAAFEQKDRTRSVRAIARDHGLVTHETVDGSIFYHFEDGSVLGAKGRARAHRLWTLPPITTSIE